MRYALAISMLLAAAPAAAQQSSDRLPWFVVDAHAATVGIPQAEGWVPEVPANTTLPGRYWGMAGGATVYPLRFGIVTFGVGASLIRGGRTAETEVVTGTGPTATTRVTAAVYTGITSFEPQLSINLGRRLGWSYLSAGIGRSKVTSRTEPSRITPVTTTSTTPPTTTTPVLPIVVPEAWNQSLNFGGGARWFMKPRLGAGFDVRFITLSSRAPTEILPSARRTRLWNISAGISIQ